MSRRALFWLARFAALYGALAGLAAVLPVYRELERPLVVLANALLREHAMESRALSLERRGDAAVYVYALRLGEQSRRIEQPLHAHGFVGLLFAALVASTPWPGARRFAGALAGGVALVGAIMLLMLMSDVESWERSAVAAMGLQPGVGPYWVPLGLVAGLHQTAAAGVIPIAYWALVAVRPGALRG
ncbi:MAG TPA: hypothetical protein VEN47_07290 [Myxococcota bacterium]|nr:hypothetical protein [Myxococcota bacterium]